MTDRLYYHNSFLYDFVAALEEVRTLADGRTALVLDRTAFYPTSGGQVFDTGWLELEPLEAERGKFLPKLRVSEVAEEEDGTVLHIVDGEKKPTLSLREKDGARLQSEGADSLTRVRGFIDVERRRDHMQQHSGQHVLSAAFIELFDMATVSFHMGEESCTIDLDTKSLTAEQVKRAEARANEIVLEDREVEMRFVTMEEARGLGLRKLPPEGHEKLRLIDIKNFDLCACGGTHVLSTGQIGAILLRKIEKAKQGMRVEFVCGQRAVETARKDFEKLTEAAALFSGHIWEVPDQVRKTLDENKAAGKAQQKLLEEIAELRAEQIVSRTTEQNGVKLIAQVFADRDLAFVRLLAQKLVKSSNVVALLGAGAGQATLVFAQSPGMKFDMGALMKETMTALGARGGGNKDMAQGGVPDSGKLQEVIEKISKFVIGK
jgi:alanyl-tRNA synthetase